MTRSRTRRGPKPRPSSDAARFHVSFHDKHSLRRPRILFICPADGRLRLDARRRRGANDIYSRKNPFFKKTVCYMCDILVASVVIRLLSARCIKSSRNDTKLTAVGVSFSASGFRPDPVTPVDLSSLLAMAVPRWVFILQKGAFSVSPLPLAFVAQNVLSAPHITGEPPKNCAPARCKNTYIPCWAPFNPPRQRRKKKCQKKGGGLKMTRKENVTKM